MKKLLLILPFILIGNTFAAGPYKFFCEWQDLVKIHEEYSYEDKEIDTNWLKKMGWDKKFTISREDNVIEIEGERNSPDSIEIPINLHQVFNPSKGYVFFAGARASNRFSYSFLYANNRFFFSDVSQGFYGGVTSGIAKCTY